MCWLLHQGADFFDFLKLPLGAKPLETKGEAASNIIQCDLSKKFLISDKYRYRHTVVHHITLVYSVI